MATEIENDIIKYWINNQILYSKYKRPFKMTLEDIKDVIALRHDISNNQKQFWCYNLNGVKSISKEARDYADLHGQDLLHACATVVDSHITIFLFNIFAKLKRVKIPFRAFTNEEKAIAWLKELQKQANQ